MKKLILITILSLPGFCIGQTLQQINKAKAEAVKYIKADLLKPKSYTPLHWSKLWKSKTSYYTSPEGIQLGKELGLIRDSVTKRFKIDSINAYNLIEKDRKNRVAFDPVVSYTLIHVYKSKTLGNDWIQKVYTFHYDKYLNLLDVNTDSADKQLEELNKKKLELEGVH